MLYKTMLICVALLAGVATAELPGEVIQLGEKLDARSSSFRGGEIVYTEYQFAINSEDYTQLKSLLTSASGSPADKKAVSEFIVKRASRPLRAFDRVFAYSRSGWKYSSRRLAADQLYDTLQEKNRNATVLIPPDETAVSNGEEITAFLGQDRVELRPLSSPDYPKLMNFDISLAPWRDMLQFGTAQGQAIRFVSIAESVSLRFEDQQTPEDNPVEYTFLPKHGYAARSVVGVSAGKKIPFIDVSYSKPVQQGAALPRVMFSCEAKETPEGLFYCTVKLCESWNDGPIEEIFTIDLPQKYTLIDLRFGQIPSPVVIDSKLPTSRRLP